jgi:hypothetical protein
LSNNQCTLVNLRCISTAVGSRPRRHFHLPITCVFEVCLAAGACLFVSRIASFPTTSATPQRCLVGASDTDASLNWLSLRHRLRCWRQSAERCWKQPFRVPVSAAAPYWHHQARTRSRRSRVCWECGLRPSGHRGPPPPWECGFRAPATRPRPDRPPPKWLGGVDPNPRAVHRQHVGDQLSGGVFGCRRYGILRSRITVSAPASTPS